MDAKDVEALITIAQTIHTTMVTRVYGDDGAAMLKKLLAAIKDLYRRISPDVHAGIILVVKSLSDNPALSGTPETITSLDALPALKAHCEVLQTFSNGTYSVWHLENLDPFSISQKAIVYKFHKGTEFFYAENERAEVIKVAPAFASNFGIPTFHDLRTALEQYKNLKARQSSCKLLQDIWYDGNRLFLKVKPESVMRDSLGEFLDAVLGTRAEVRPEQNMDESKPVDIKVTWFMAQKIAIIEIKWMGSSRDDTEIRTEYKEARANEGAEQLAGYLNMNKQHAPLDDTRGYLVVYDARRRGLKVDTKSLKAADALYYQAKEIVFSPEYHSSRDDFETPFRFFLEPLHD